MNYLEAFLFYSTIGFEVVLCGFVFAKRAQGTLPLFAAYASALLAESVGMWLVYRFFGFQSLAGYYSYWTSLVLIAIMRSLSIAELCRYKLRAYHGIWGLVWRLLAGVAFLSFLHAAFDTWGQPHRLAIYSLTLDRDLDIVSVAILAALLLIHNYYELSLEPLQRSLAVGICFICSVDIIGDTILQSLYVGYLFPFFGAASKTSFWFSLKHHYDRINEIWSAIHLLSFMAAIGIWCFALRKPIPVPAKAPALLPAEVYRELSPAINLRLSAFNDRLVELLKP